MRRFLLFIVLTVAIMATWTYFFPPPKPVPKPAAVPEASGSPGSQEIPGTTAGTPALPDESPGPAQPGLPAANLPPWAGQPVQAAAEEQVTLEDETTRAVFTNRGAQLVSLQLKNQKTHQGGAVELVRKRAEGPYPFSLVRREGLAPHPLDQVLFQVQRGADGSLSFRYRGQAGVAEKRFRFDEQGFLESVINVPGGDWALAMGPGLGNPTAEEMGSRYGRRGAVYKQGSKVEVLNAQREDEVKTVSGRVLWIGLEDTYFLSALIPRAGLDEVVIQPLMTEGSAPKARFLPLPGKDDITSDQKKLPREFRVILEPEGGNLTLLSYWGDKNYDRLASLPYDLEGAVKLGTFAFLARPLLVALHWIHDNVVANYGWAIILLTIVIKILLLPLTHNSMRSMKRMQELNPRVQSIREKYRTKLKDKQGRPNLEVQRKMNDEVMAIYKEAGVNPVGGCLPMLLQMPILFAFFNLLTAAVELRNAPWMLWVMDLASKDPYYVLPIVMGAAQWFQVRMAPQSGDPMQRRMFELMPIVMTVMFLSVPSGLVLYWLTNNILTILQQAVYKRLEKRAA
ncbi:MAG: YidC/Oxa1 family rane protein insertase [Acidobacteriota bacterium]|jgi:YidC/Oxa1 family membrane protein insertase|nr:YidC/Oxa1 family rane protein insertase [Acidobacteriota bacterium]